MANLETARAKIAPLFGYVREYSTRHRKLLLYSGAFFVYLAISLWVTGMVGHSLTKDMFSESGDPNGYLFFLKWWPWAILHGHNPFLVHGLTYPATYNAAWITSVASPSLLAAPVTLLFGPVVSWNLIILFAPVSAALSMLWLLDYIEVPAFPAILGGFLFGFSSYEIGELSSHLFLVLIFPLPLLVLVTLLRLRGRIRPLWFVVLSVLLLAFLLYTSTEISLTFALSALGAIGLFALWYWKELVRQIRVLIRELAAIAVGVLVFTSPLLYYLISGLSIGGTVINSPYTYSTDLLNIVIPTPVTYLGSKLVTSISASFTGNFSEEGGYIGIILLILVVMAIVEGVRSRRWSVPFAVWIAALVICTLGPVLHVDGNVTAIRLPWILPAHLPILKNILPSRLMVYVAFGLAIWIPLWVSWGTTKKARVIRFVAAGVGTILLIPNPAAFFWASPYIPGAVTDGQLAAYAGDGSGMLVVPRGQAIPFADGHLGVVWSEASGFKLDATMSPWGYNPYSSRMGYARWPLSVISSAAFPPPGTARQLQIFCAVHHDTAVAVPTGIASTHAWSSLLGRLGWQYHVFQGVTVYRVPKSILAQYSHASAADADKALYVSELEVLKNAAACYLAHGGQLSALTPDAAIADRCLASGYAGQSATSNWTVESGWIGPQGSNVGIGIGTTGNVASAVFTNLQKVLGSVGVSGYMLYDPQPHSITLHDMAGSPQGTYLMILSPASLTNHTNRLP